VVKDLLDECPHCGHLFEILAVRFRFTGVAMVYACSNCALAQEEQTEPATTVFIPQRVKTAFAQLSRDVGP
jgi:hypothetical protein